MRVAHGDDCDDLSLYHWAKKCEDGKLGRADVCDQERSECPVTATSELHMRMIDEVIKENWQITQREIAVNLGNS